MMNLKFKFKNLDVKFEFKMMNLKTFKIEVVPEKMIKESW